MKRSLSILAALLIALGLASLGFWKRVHMDDAAFLRVARQMRAYPGDPYGFHWDYLGESTSALVGMPHPPLHAGVLAVLLERVSDTSPAVHLVGVAAMFVLFLGCFRLGRSFAGGSRLALVATTSPIVAVLSTGLMSDVPALAWTALAIGFHPVRPEERRWWRSLLSGVALALAVATRYACLAFALIPWVSAGRTRRDQVQRILATAPAVLTFFALQGLTKARYGITHLAAILGHAAAEDAREPLLRAFAFLPTLAILVPAAVIALPTRRWRFVPWTLAALGAAIAMPWGLELSTGRHGIAYDEPHRILACLLAALGAALLVGACQAMFARERRGERLHGAALLLVGSLAVFATPKSEARYVLPLLPGFLLALGPRLARIPRMRFGTAVVFQVGLAATLAMVDVRASRVYTNAVTDVPASSRATGRETYLRGELGFRHAFERHGLRYLGAHDDEPRPGDRLLRSEMATPSNARFAERVTASLAAQPVSTWVLDDAFPVRLHQPHAGAGFYGHTAGLLPFAFSSVPHDRLHLFAFEEVGTFLDLARAIATSADARFPWQRYLKVVPMRPTLVEPERRSLCLVGRTNVRYPVHVDVERSHLRGSVAEPARMVIESIAGTGTHVTVRVQRHVSAAPDDLVWELTIRSRTRVDDRRWFPIDVDLERFGGEDLFVVLAVECAPEDDPDSAVAFGIFSDVRLD